jgi:2-oxoglutarate ferredoxin oxidoreductase subunit alpha
MLRLISIWPFPDYLIKDLMTRVKNIIVPEINLGQMVREIQRCATDDVK